MSHSSHHEYEPSAVSNTYAAREISRRAAIARIVGIGATILTPGYLSSCGNQQIITQDGNQLTLNGEADSIQRIDVPASATRGAVRMNPPELPSDPVILVEPGSYVVDGDPSLPLVSYSIDDVPGKKVVRTMMDTCDQESVPGVLGFFGVGIYLNTYVDVSQEIVNRGHKIHNHSWSHQYDIDTNISEVDPMQELLAQLNKTDNRIFRNPGGYVSQKLLDFLASRNLFYLWTTVDLGDWKLPRPSESTLISRHRSALRAGRHFLLHGSDGHGTTARALPHMFRDAKARGFIIVSPEEHMSAGSPTKRALRIAMTQNEITQSYIDSERFNGIPMLEANWIVTLETSLEESTHLTAKAREMLTTELESRKKLLGIQ